MAMIIGLRTRYPWPLLQQHLSAETVLSSTEALGLGIVTRLI